MSSNNDDSNVVDDGLSGGKISSWAPAAAVASSATTGKDLSTDSTFEKDISSVCPHLEQLMFPKFLSLDCNQLDEFCMGRVTDTTNVGRLYIEALHLKDFLKDTDTLTKEYNKKGRSKRASPARPPSKKKSRGADAKDGADEKALSQTIWGGLEGKRTCILSSSDGGIAGTYCPMVPRVRSSQEGDPILQELHQKKLLLDTESSDEALDIFLNSELRLRTLQKSFQLHDKTAMFDNYVCNTSDDVPPPQDDEFRVFEDLAKPLPYNQPPSLQNTNPQGAATADEMDVEKNTETNNAPLVSSATSVRTTATNEAMDTEEKITETASPPKMTTNEVATTEQVVAKRSSTSDESIVLLPPESSAQIELGVKAAEVALPNTIFHEGKVAAVEKVSTETKTITTPSVENPQDQLAVSATPRLKQSDSPRAPKATAMQRLTSSSLNEKVIEETAESLHKRAVREGKDASFAANKMLSSFRQNRRTFWNASIKSEMKCVWCSSSDDACMKSSKNHPVREFGVIKDAPVSKKGEQSDNELISRASGDDLIQCLECDLIGCRSGFVGGKSHAMLHFLMSGHTYGVTCGESGEIFCMRCGDIVQHECFDRERERVFLEQNHPSLCWKESPINRGINPSSFTVTKEQGYVWRGLLASFPIPATPQFVRAGHFALRRALMFRGCSTSKMATLGPNALKLTLYRQSHCKLFFLLSHHQIMKRITNSFSHSSCHRVQQTTIVSYPHQLVCTISEILAT